MIFVYVHQRPPSRNRSVLLQARSSTMPKAGLRSTYMWKLLILHTVPKGKWSSQSSTVLSSASLSKHPSQQNQLRVYTTNYEL